jgi:hypothetical protein
MVEGKPSTDFWLVFALPLRQGATTLSTLIELSVQPLDEVLLLPPNGSFPFPML